MGDKNDFYIDENGKVRLINAEERKKRLLEEAEAAKRKPVYRGEGAVTSNTITAEPIRTAERTRQQNGVPSGRNRKKKKAKRTGFVGVLKDFFESVVEWISESTSHIVIAIAGALVLVIALVAGISALANSGGSTNITKPEDYVQVLEIDKDEYAGVLLEESKSGGDSYIKETLFIGDSNFARFPLYNILSLDNVIGIESLGAEDVNEWKQVYFEGMSSPVTIPEAVGLMKPRRIVFCVGTNNINDDDVDTFIKDYKAALDAIKSKYAYSDVILCAIPPFGESRSNKNLTIDKVNKFNMALLDLAKERGLTYLNITEAISASNGYMRAEYVSEDGIHFTKSGLEALLSYVKTHVHDVDDSRPQPLGDIPKRKSAPVIVTEKETFDVNTMLNYARSAFTAAGHSVVTAVSGTSQTVTYSLPLETKPGEEANAANWFYSYVLKGIKFDNGYKSLQVAISGEETASEYKFYATVAPAYCSGEHKFVVDSSKSKDATCTAKGTKVEVCSECGYIKTTELPMLEHKFDNSAATTTQPAGKEATCGAPGYEHKWCTLCKTWIKLEIKATGEHSFVEDTSKSKAATCTTKGVTYSTCSKCGQTKSEEIAALGHDYKLTSCTDNGDGTHKHVETCTRCNDVKTIESEAHTNGTSTYTDNGDTHTEKCECTLCHVTIILQNAVAHVWDGGTVVAPTCTSGGYTHYSCVCGKTRDDNHTDALGHEWGEGVLDEETGITTYTCTRCSETKTEGP